MDTIAIVAALVNLIVLGGFAWWIVGWLRSLKGAVDAQKETITAQKEIIQNFQALLDEADMPKMVKKVKAYKQFVDHEKEIWEQSVKRQWDEEKQKSSQAMDMMVASMPYVPREERKKIVELSDFDDQIKELLFRLADKAPDLSPDLSLSQAATSEIIRVVLSSRTDIQPVLDVIVKNAARLCEAPSSTIHIVDGNVMRRVATVKQLSSAPIGEEIPLTRDRIPARAIIDRKTIHAIDKDMPLYLEIPAASLIVSGLHDVKTMVAMPLLRESNEAIGCIVVGRFDYRPFTATQIVLLKIFADQAVIAMEPRFRE